MTHGPPGAAPHFEMTTPDETKHITARDRLRHPLPRARVPGIPELSPPTRIALLIFGWLMMLAALVGSLLPLLQGWIFFVVGAAALSLVSRTMLNLLRFLMRPWPRAWRALLRSRRKVHRWITKGR